MWRNRQPLAEVLVSLIAGTVRCANSRLFFFIVGILTTTSCAPARQADASALPAQTSPAATVSAFLPLVSSAIAIPKPPLLASFQIQYTGALDTSVDVAVFNLDLFDTPSAVIQTLRARRIFVMCYFSAGSYEDWRPDAQLFSAEVLGNDMAGWPGEKWLDVRRFDLLGSIMEARLELAVQKGCDGVDPDNVDGYRNDTGFPLTAQDQLAYNRFLSAAAHRRGLAIGLKNNLLQAAELVSDFDWILNEECFTYQECHLLQPFKQAGKPVFVIEYDRSPHEICPQARELGFNVLIKNLELDAYRIDCGAFSNGR
ncbi:MAG: endo alpha-1,4 polygalactosaminidase [Candidatus Roseilinea sp.]|uniref:endo alpha-1,4 polygalactosaminidase n=1 Tax=Candidatus Roseilinea sp. TaxID=2838777 RepID=UPI00404AAE03